MFPSIYLSQIKFASMRCLYCSLCPYKSLLSIVSTLFWLLCPFSAMAENLGLWSQNSVYKLQFSYLCSL